jgi:VIT1/CCC1 family predicted Fe2+/Mn2+ transporter
VRSAATIAGSYIVGGLIPLAPYILMNDSHQALVASACVTLAALGVFGYVKGHFTGVPKLKSAYQTALIGSLAAGVAYLIAKWIA